MSYDTIEKSNGMFSIYDDIQNFFELIKNSNVYNNYLSYLEKDKNLATCGIIEESEVVEKRTNMLMQQKNFDKKVHEELLLFDSINIPIIGIKGLFLKNKYYGNIERVFDDIDILVSSDNAQNLYKELLKLGYHIKFKTMYDNPIFNMKFFPKTYMDNTQTLMMFNTHKKVSIDIHSNLNITNAHFVKSTTKFDTNIFFENSIQFGDYKNIKCLELHDNLCVLFRHLLKHHVFYGKTQTGLETPLQHILDLAVLINSNEFEEDKLFIVSTKYNIVPEALFCLNLYNKIFKSCKKVEISPYLNKLENINYEFTWKPILMASLNMSIEDLMIGNYGNEFPKLQKAVSISQSIPIGILDWLCQAFIISFSVKYLL